MPALATAPGSRILAAKPVTLSAPNRGDDLAVRISAPATGTDLPLLVLAHGFSLAMDSYDPLVDHWAANGFIVIQPTFLDSAALGLTPADPRYASIWSTRVDDVELVIDHLDEVVAAIPGLPERVDRDRLAVAGHSWGSQTVGMLLGARVVGADGRPGEDRTDPRVKAGVLLAATGLGGEALTPFARENFSFMSPDFDRLNTPTLVVAGDHDQSLLSTRGPDWFTDVYALSPGARSLLTVFGGEHTLGGVHGYNATNTTDESPERVDLVRRVSAAFLLKALGLGDDAWDRITEEVSSAPEPVGRIDSK
ncbi:S9 family peptidase [Umezawaea endophytica]|uniref:S9 family peptidase n=1 Tax=Umezawaea endophytica TaxID=1654476 RepID=A0A9X2VKK8_9PSEU|nr:S9 family peptidase [Umezawaea endophytica]MCS7476873.1 S9 family peptidase [Umezawaea endophytica]